MLNSPACRGAVKCMQSVQHTEFRALHVNGFQLASHPGRPRIVCHRPPDCCYADSIIPLHSAPLLWLHCFPLIRFIKCIFPPHGTVCRLCAGLHTPYSTSLDPRPLKPHRGNNVCIRRPSFSLNLFMSAWASVYPRLRAACAFHQSTFI